MPRDKYGPRLKPVIELIDSIHRIQTTSQIPIRITRSKLNQGEYHYRRGSFEPDSIEISRINDSMEATLLHEVGHLLEQAILPGCSYGQRQWASGGLTGAWWESIQATQTFKALRQLHDIHECRPFDANGKSEAERLARWRWIAYLMLPRELWARSYAQWIAERGDHVPTQRFFRQRSSPASVVPLQWSWDDFAPVAEQFDQLFAGLGWLR